jgi:outer membrane receptor protein involved in Fe transport
VKIPPSSFLLLALASVLSAAEPTATVLPGVVVADGVQPDRSLGGSAYALDSNQIETLGQGEDAGFNRVMLRTPGVSQDSAGQVHFREEDPYYQYMLDGILLPAGINGFGQDIDPRFVDSVSFKVGALPAQYDWGSYGIIDIRTKAASGPATGEISLYGGSYHTLHPSVVWAGSAGATSVFATASTLHDTLGIENPTPSATALHDATDQYKAFADLTRQLTDTSRVSLILSGSHADFQIPDNPNQTSVVEFRGRERAFPVANSALLNETQDEQTYYAIAAYQQAGPDLGWQVSATSRYSGVLFRPDQPGDLYFNGVSARVQREILTQALQADVTSHWAPDQALRAGLRVDAQAASEADQVTVFAAEDDDVDPVTGLTEIKGAPFTIPDNHFKHGYDSDLYLQDEWTASDRLTLNAGARLDWTDAYVNEHQLSPRLNAAYRLSADTVLHAGYARYFIPPPLESVSPASVSKFDDTTNAADVDTDSPVKSERSDYFDAGLTHDFSAAWHAGVDAYSKRSVNQIDDGQFGAANIYSPYNFAHAKIYGLEVSAEYARGGLAAYANFAAAQAWARGIVSSQFEFDADELAYIQTHDIHPDQTQFFTGSAGVSYAWGRTQIHADAFYGSGIRSGFANLGSLPANYPVNVGLVRQLAANRHGHLTLRLDVINLFDQVYEMNDGTGIGVGAPKFGNRRGIFGGVAQTF